MLCVKTKIQPSKISGIGLFADEYISKGTVVWKFEPRIDLLLSKDDISKLSSASQKQFFNYAFLDTSHGKYMLCGDDGRFFNHSDDPNCDDSSPNITFANTEILPGEELTVNYKVFYGNTENLKTLQ